MQLIYSNPQETTITVTLDEGEVGLGDLVGPTVAHVPTDPLNRHYAEILDNNLEVFAYEAPPQTQEETNGDDTNPGVKVTTTRTVTR